MPSIPQSLLWISLVVLWLFVLVPMLISKRDAVRRTSDVALATRVLNGGDKSRLLKRKGRPAAGHRHDPDWQRDEDEFDDIDSDDEVQPVRTRSVVVVTAVTEEIAAEPDYLDVDVVDEDSGALPVGGGAARAASVQPTLFDETVAPVVEEAPVEAVVPVVADSDEEETIAEGDATDQFEAITGAAGPATSGLAGRRHCRRIRIHRGHFGFGGRGGAADDADAGRGPGAAPRVVHRRRRDRAQVPLPQAGADGHVCGHDPDRRAGLHRERRPVVGVRQQRRGDDALPGLSAPPDPHRGAGAPSSSAADGAVAARGGEHRGPRFRRGAVPAAPARCRVLDIDDEDPIFEHLDEVPFARHYDLPRAAGQ